MRTGLLACLALLLLAAPASAVVGGTPQNSAEVRWYADVGNCGGTLIAPASTTTSRSSRSRSRSTASRR